MNFREIKSALANTPTFIMTLVPVFKSCPPCPVCMPKYAALFAFFGLELADYSAYLEPLMVMTMLVSLVIMGRQVVVKESSFWPLLGATGCSMMIFATKFIMPNFWALQAGVIGLIVSHYCHYLCLSALKKTSCSSNGDCGKRYTDTDAQVCH